MHILIAIIGAAAAAFFAFRYFVDAAHEGREALRDARGLVRRGKWTRRIDARVVENLSDPREAAGVLLYQIAAYDGAVTDAQKTAIISEMRGAFSADEETAEGLFAFARVGVGEINDAANSLKKILQPVVDSCTDEEKRMLLEMMARIAAVEGVANEPQKSLIAATDRTLFPK